MFRFIYRKIKDIFENRIALLQLLFVGFAVILILHLFKLQIINGENYQKNFVLQIEKQKTISATRGKIYDRNGKLLAGNETVYVITMEDNGTYQTRKEKNLSTNSTIYQVMKLIEPFGDQLQTNFAIGIDGAGEYVYTQSGFNLVRFKADVFGIPDPEDMTNLQKNISAKDMMAYLVSKDMYQLESNLYSKSELDKYGLPETLSKEEELKIISIRAELSKYSYEKYKAVTISGPIKKESVVAIEEHKGSLQGIDIGNKTLRYYPDGKYLSSIIGYTGEASSEEIANLSLEKDGYKIGDIIGKAGIEKSMEIQLQGEKGFQNLLTDNLGKILEEKEKTDPIAGNDVYLTIDKDLQIAAYHILEQKVAGIVKSKLHNIAHFKATPEMDTKDLIIPITEAYSHLILNRVIDIEHFKDKDATDLEKSFLKTFEGKQAETFALIKNSLEEDKPVAYNQLNEWMQHYVDYIVDDLLTYRSEILRKDAINTLDEVYVDWSLGRISMKEYLNYAISKNWVDISKLTEKEGYLDGAEVYQYLTNYIQETLVDDIGFSGLIYEELIYEGTLVGNQVCALLYDQGVLPEDPQMRAALESGAVGGYDFIISKLDSLEITPAMLALYPYSASAVITDVNTGDVLALASYPSYDNNLMTSNVKGEYYAKLLTDMSEPLYNKATQERTAPGSTFKMISALAGLNEGVLGEGEVINCQGVFDKVEPPTHCWNKDGHGPLDLRLAIRQSCNVYFDEIGYRLSITPDHVYSDNQGTQRLAKYAESFGLGKVSGVELPESEPNISDRSAISPIFILVSPFTLHLHGYI